MVCGRQVGWLGRRRPQLAAARGAWQEMWRSATHCLQRPLCAVLQLEACGGNIPPARAGTAVRGTRPGAGRMAAALPHTHVLCWQPGE